VTGFEPSNSRHELIVLPLIRFRCAKECIDDINIMFKNCYHYNKPDEDVCLMANSLEKFFLSKLKAMPPVEVELTAEMMRRGGLSGTPKSAPRPKKPSGPDLVDSDSMQSGTSDPLEIKPISVNNQSGWSPGSCIVKLLRL
jgi:hypothetical protein